MFGGYAVLLYIVKFFYSTPGRKKLEYLINLCLTIIILNLLFFVFWLLFYYLNIHISPSVFNHMLNFLSLYTIIESGDYPICYMNSGQGDNLSNSEYGTGGGSPSPGQPSGGPSNEHLAALAEAGKNKRPFSEVTEGDENPEIEKKSTS